MKNILKQLTLAICLISILLLPYFVFAVDNDSSLNTNKPLDRLKNVGTVQGPYVANDSSTFLVERLGMVIAGVLAFVGVVFIIVIIVSGFKWMMAGGNEEQIQDAQKHIKNAILGTIITFSAYSVWYLIYYLFIQKGNLLQ